MIEISTSDSSRALGGTFARVLAALGPFEAAPCLAVAVSGGADSMALALLADDWARARGGRIHALTVDHGLRAESGEEALRVGAWLRARGIDHHVLAWNGAKPATAMQARARDARYALLGGWCRGAGVVHLLLAHQRQDQAETLLLRLAAGSGPDGLAGMSALVETADVRLLRPLLRVPPDALRAFLAERGQPWIEDPSNDDPRFARVRMRQAVPALAALGMTVETLAAAADRFAAVRVALEAGSARVVARAVRLDPAGFAVLSPDEFADVPDEIAARALARVLACVGGRAYPPSLERVAALLAVARGINPTGGARGIGTLAGCVLECRAGTWLVRREARGLPAPEWLRAGCRPAWDGRFDVTIAPVFDDADRMPLTLAPLGEAGWREIVDHAPVFRRRSPPRAVLAVLPALRDGQGVVRVPHLGYVRPEIPKNLRAWLMAAKADFRPRRPLAGSGFFVAPVAPAVDDAK